MPRSGIESEQWDHLLDSLEGVMLNPSEDRWSWDLNGSEEFSVVSARRAMETQNATDLKKILKTTEADRKEMAQKMQRYRQGNGTAEEYSREFEYLLMKCDVTEDDPQTLVHSEQRSKGKFDPASQSFRPTTYSKPTSTYKTTTPTNSHSSMISNPKSEPSKAHRGFEFESDLVASSESPHNDEVEVTGPEEGQCLVICRTLSTTPVPETELQRELIFHTHCTIAQKVTKLTTFYILSTMVDHLRSFETVNIEELGYDGVDAPMYYHYLRPMPDLDVEHRITKLNYYYMLNSEIRATIEEYHEDMGVESSSASPRKNEFLMLEWYDNSTPTKASSNTRDHLPRVSSQFKSISQAFETQEKTVGDVIEDVMKRLSFGITDIDDHLDIVSCVVVHFVGSCHDGLSHDETFGTNDLDNPSPFNLNIPAHVSIDEGIVSGHVNVQDRIDEELGNQNEANDVNHATSIGEDIHNHDFEYDADSSKDEKANDYVDVMIDEKNEIHEAEVEVHLFGLRESDYQFTNIVVSSEVPTNVFMKKDGYEMDIDDFDTDSGVEGDCLGGRISELTKFKKAFIDQELLVLVLIVLSGYINCFIEKCMNELKSLNVRAHAWLSKILIEHWSRAHFSDLFKYSIFIHGIHFFNLDEEFGGGGAGWRPMVTTTWLAEGDSGIVMVGGGGSFQRWFGVAVMVVVWCGCSSRAHTDILLNNLCEVFNGKIVGGRDKPVITLLEYICEYCMERIVNVQTVIDKCDGLLTPIATRIIDSIKKEATYITVMRNGEIKKRKTFQQSVSTLGGMFGNQRQASRSQAGVSQADMVGSHTFGSQADMVGSQAFGSQTNGIGTQTSVAVNENRVNSV
nr:hypothetical protein [Tanacetum cinerariifolium]